MLNLITFVLSTFGLAYLITRSDLFRGVREFVSGKKWKWLSMLLNCVFCCSVWSGLIVWVCRFYHVEIVIDIFAGASGSIIIYELIFKIKK